MRLALKPALLAAAALTLALPAAAAPVDTATLNRIADAGFNRSHVVQTVSHLTDRIGGRMTNSPAMRQAEKWTAEQFRGYGLSNVRADPFEFGRGWSIERSSVRMVEPRPQQLRAIPIAWTPAAKVTAPIVVAPMRRERDFAEWRGKLAGKIVLVSWPAPPKDDTDPDFKRLTDADIAKLNDYRQPSFDPTAEDRLYERVTFEAKMEAFLKAEGAVAYAKMSRLDNGRLHGEGDGFKVGKTPPLPAVELSAEDYRRLARLAKTGPVTLEIDSQVRFDDGDRNAYNILADLPGRDPKAGYVMAGAHLDSWVAADGAADNAAGSAVIMEAARILASLGVQPKRTIRFALWNGEEQGLYGSLAYVEKYLARRPPNANAERANMEAYYFGRTYPITKQPGYGELAGYFNIDNGSGKLRGIYAEGNFAAVPQLREWLSPLSSLGASQVVAAPTGGTDHVFMQRVGLPAFQFIQDPLDYGSQVHHTDIDTFDHLRADDLRQAAVVLASVLWSAANDDKPLPGNVLPTQPGDTDPYRYPNPDDR